MSAIYSPVIRQKFTGTYSALWTVNPGTTNNPITYNTSTFNFIGNPVYNAASPGGGGLATWAPQNPNGLVWNSNGQLSIPASGKWALNLVIVGANLGGNIAQYALSLLSAPANAAFGNVAVNNSGPSLTNVLATGQYNSSGEQTVSCVVPLVAGSLVSLVTYPSPDSGSTVSSSNLPITLSAQLMERW